MVSVSYIYFYDLWNSVSMLVADRRHVEESGSKARMSTSSSPSYTTFPNSEPRVSTREADVLIYTFMPECDTICQAYTYECSTLNHSHYIILSHLYLLAPLVLLKTETSFHGHSIALFCEVEVDLGLEVIHQEYIAKYIDVDM